ncbi:MAG: cytochrome c family protein [Sandaracinaceae bacterium]|nr:cytochrome c family protein [Sandaracinaceae bacterium]
MHSPLPGRLLVLTALAVTVGCEPTNQGYEPTQPIQYSHALHAGTRQIPCQYCHYDAERSRHAGIPAAEVCMNCHSQVLTESPEIQRLRGYIERGEPIPWERVHRLPDFVYFNHSWHIEAGRQCAECHGAIEQMARVRQDQPLTMGWCLDCHRQHNATQPPGSEQIASTDCSACHY